MSAMLMRVPVVRAYTVEITLHHSACTEQITLTVPWADAMADPPSSAAATKSFFMEFSALSNKKRPPGRGCSVALVQVRGIGTSTIAIRRTGALPAIAPQTQGKCSP
ncbi:hypothetical protein [Variovorax sp. UC122_21]|uniref:hypothetical protein n=1 Tax=Variovorax sp. UC122_21 TaxID=3374554 RepID=UPI003757BD4C